MMERRSTFYAPLFLLPVLALALALLALACGGGEKEGEEGGATATATEEGELFVDPNAPVVDVSLKEFSVTPSEATGQAGATTFEASNNGSIEHNLYVFKSDLAIDKLPVANGRVPKEGGAGVEFIGEIPSVEAGKTVAATFDLEPGKYVLLCNISGHYEAGMHAAFTVK